MASSIYPRAQRTSSRREGALIFLRMAFLIFLPIALAACGGAWMANAAVPADGSRYEIRDGMRYQVEHWTRDKDGNKVPLPLADPVPADDKPATKPVQPKPDAAAGIYQAGAFIGTVSRLLLLASIAGLIASYFVPWLPRATALKGFAVALALIIVQFWVTKYGVAVAEVSFWVTIITAVGAAIAIGYPWAVGLYNRNLIKVGQTLASKGDYTAGAALVIAGSPDNFKAPGEKSALKASLAKGAVAGGAQ